MITALITDSITVVNHLSQGPPMPVLDSFSLAGKTAFLTGGSRGLGRAMSQALGEAGAAVALSATTLDGARRAAGELQDLGINAYGVQLEVSDREDVDRAVADITENFGEIDILVNNAGGGVGGAAFDAAEDTWRQVMSVNVDGVWYCSRAVAQQMAGRGGGVIINIGSMSAWIVNQPRWQISYLTSKAAVHHMTEGLAAEWAPYGIRVNAIAPGYFHTDNSPIYEPEYKPYCVDPAPMKRGGEPRELGGAVVFLASEASSFMTGSIVKIDGGFTLF
ncbi:short-chain dehydrogenase [Microlunatus endophyticus]|uniref:Short-chain dehydrogenase n=1 Tax=Microlunatus endophyticus TaxID=1716077 RepID=A0A917S2X3_9ACTN|nr:SDR family oxidoreductase [Microlunatus endophyticus]GGL53694.1 short-chain dehydrogenase [Microlunatus endophyticus]